MPWVRITDDFYDNPKIASVGSLAVGVWLAGLAYANRNLTDGFIPRGAAHGLAIVETVDDTGRVWEASETSGGTGEDVTGRRIAERLVAAGLWEPAEGGYQIHDFDHYQPSRADVIESRDQARERKANQRARARSQRTSQRTSQRDPQPTSPGDSPREFAPLPGPVTHREEPSGSSLATRPRNEQWDGLADVFGYSPTGKAEQREWGQHAATLKDAGVDQAGVARAAELYELDMTGATITPRALTKHAQRLLAHESQIRAKANGTRTQSPGERALRAAGLQLGGQP